MKCLILVVLLISASFVQNQESSDGGGNNNDSNPNMNTDNNNENSDLNNNDGNTNNDIDNNVNTINIGSSDGSGGGSGSAIFNNINSGNLNSMMRTLSNSNGISNRNFNVNSNSNNNNNNNFNGEQQTMNNFNVGNPDLGRISRPCSSYDIDCIRRFFAQHADCKVTKGPIPEPLYREQITSFVPRVNLTITPRKVKIRGVSNGRIEEFFVNRDTDKVVLAIEFKGLYIQSNNSFFRIHRRSKEPIVVKDYYSVNYQSVVITAIIPKIYNLQLEKTVVFAFVNDPEVRYNFGPRVTDSKDPEVQATYKAFLLNPRANVGEILLTDAPYYPTTYIQYNICDFGLKIL